MQAVVKTPHIEISVKGATIPPRLMKVLKEEYGKDLNLVENDEEKLVNIFDSAWYKSIKGKMTPGKYLRVYRENKGLTQTQLGDALGGLPRQHISNMEHGLRAISLKMAGRLSSLLGAPVERFIDANISGDDQIQRVN
jgi:plasmid maintenance system antidote protein VapI